MKNAKSANQQQTAKELIAANVQILMDQLERGHSEAFTAYLAAMSRFHTYSFGNILEIARQRPDATRVAGLHTWNKFGRRVKKGEKGIRILAPIVCTKGHEDENAERDSMTTRRRFIAGFRAVYVFDVSQTDGDELPEPAKVTGEVGEHRALLMAFLDQVGIEIEYNEAIAPAQGVSYGGRIAVLPGQEPAEELATLIHETAHELLHRNERRATTTRTTRELEAEAVAFVVGQAIGLEMGTTSADYIQLYQGDAAMLMDSLEAIQNASAVILRATLRNETLEK
jgi:antirestriction protein ArdC